MIISTNNLNDIETKITTPQVEGIELINAVLDSNNNISKINASYNDIISILEDGKLPVIRKQTSQEIIFLFLRFCNFDDYNSRYICEIINDENHGFVASSNTEDLYFSDLRL